MYVSEICMYVMYNLSLPSTLRFMVDHETKPNRLGYGNLQN